MTVADAHFVPRMETRGPDSPEQSPCRKGMEDVVHGVSRNAGKNGPDRCEDAVGIGVRVLVGCFEHRQTLPGHAKTGCA